MNAIVSEGRLRFAVLPELDPALARDIEAAWWPIERLGEGLDVLGRHARLRDGATAEATPPPPDGAGTDELARWFEWAGERLGIEIEPVEAGAAEAEAFLRRAGPAVILRDEARGRGFLLLAAAEGGRLRLIGPDHRPIKCRTEALRAALCWAHEAPLEPHVSRLLQAADVPARRREKVKAAMLKQRLGGVRLGGVWLLRTPASTGFWRQLAGARTPATAGGVLGVFALVYGLEILSWILIGGAALNGRLDFGWLAAWLLLVLTLVPFRLAGGWLESNFALEAGRILKSRLLAGALRMDPEKVIRQGVGHLIGRVMEAQALESLALNGGLAVIVAVIELGFGGWVLAHGAAAGPHLTLLATGVAVIGWLSWRYWRRLTAWSQERLTLTNTLIEGMVGHRTRLAQEREGRRDAEEDRALLAYMDSSKAMDRAGVVVLAGLPSAWVLLGLLGLAPAFVHGGGPSAVSLAISLGGMLITQRALGGISGGLAALIRAGVAWRQVSAIADSTPPATEARPFLTPAQESGFGGRAPLAAGHGLSFRYDPERDPVIRDAALTITRGDRILLEGPSGGGKSTLASLITGLRTPQSGLLLLNGLDRHTLGDDWRRLVTSAPQFHENHILSGPLAFNLLMGKRWPPTEADLAEATALCEDLGLGDLIRRMPAGILQRVGETGWQLSHGERSRIFLARALLQGAELTILDESFAALDPETLERSLRTTLARAGTLMVIAHP